jgi:hypothetical protein
MARKIKETAKTAAKGSVPAEELKRIVKEHQRQTATAQEYNGRAGQAIKTFIDNFSVDRKAFRFVLGLSKMEETKRQATLRQVIDLAHKLEMFDAVDAFDDVVATMESICEEIRARADEPRKADSVVSAVLQ